MKHSFLPFVLLLASSAWAKPVLVEVAPAEGGAYVAPDSVFAREIVKLNAAVAANPQDGFSLAWRAVQWAKCNEIFRRSGPQDAPVYTPDAAFWEAHMNADIEQAAAVAPTNPLSFSVAAMAYQIAAAREIRASVEDPHPAPEAARLRQKLALYDRKLEAVWATDTKLGDRNVAGVRCWWLLKYVEQTAQEASQEQTFALLGAINAAQKSAPDDPMAALCRGIGLVTWGTTPAIRAAAAPEIETTIAAFAAKDPQQTFDNLCRIGRLLSLHNHEAAMRWLIRANGIAGAKPTADSLLLAYELGPTPEELTAKKASAIEKFVFGLSPYFEPSPLRSQRLNLLERLASWKAGKGDFKGAFEARQAACLGGGKLGNWAEAGDMQYHLHDYRAAANYYETFALDSPKCVAGRGIELDIGFVLAMGDGTKAETDAYLAAIGNYEGSVLKNHGDLVAWQEAQLEEGDWGYKNPTLQSVAAAIDAHLKEAPYAALYPDTPLRARVSDERDHFRQYAPRIPADAGMGVFIVRRTPQTPGRA